MSNTSWTEPYESSLYPGIIDMYWVVFIAMTHEYMTVMTSTLLLQNLRQGLLGLIQPISVLSVKKRRIDEVLFFERYSIAQTSVYDLLIKYSYTSLWKSRKELSSNFQT